MPYGMNMRLLPIYIEVNLCYIHCPTDECYLDARFNPINANMIMIEENAHKALILKTTSRSSMPFPLIMTSLRALLAYVSGKMREIHWRTKFISETGQMSPLNKSCGKITNGMNCTACNSVRANVDKKIPKFTEPIVNMMTMRKTIRRLPS